MKIRIGTSGWNYDHWKGLFYPPKLPQSEWLSHYVEHFDTVEINNTFYQQPAPSSFDQWKEQAPPGFLFAVKAHRYLTHMLKLKDPADPLRRLFERADRLRPHLGPVLYQLPPGWSKNLERLEEFFRHLPEGVTHVIEYRQRDWLDDDTYELMHRYRVCLCLHDMLPHHPRRVTGPAAYLRFHGSGRGGGGKYRPSRLRPWAEWIAETSERYDVYAYFNNDAKGAAIRDAQALSHLLQENGVPAWQATTDLATD